MKNQIQPTKEGAMKRRIVIALALIAVLVVGSSMIGGTLAYLSTYTPEIENVFTLGELNYQLTYVANPPDGFVDNDVLDMPVPNPAKFTIAASEHTFESTAPVLTGHKFLGWADSEDATTPDYPYNEETGKCLVTVEYDPETFDSENALTDKTVYAVWKQMDFTLSFDTQTDDVEDPKDQTVTYQLPYGELPVVERPGYTFLGWSLEENDAALKKLITEESVVDIAADHTVYAQWIARSYAIRYHANGGTGTMEDQWITYDVPTVLNKNEFIKADYTFGGWATSSEGEAEYIDQQEVLNLLEGGYLDLYAVWIQNSHTVTFDYNGGTGSPESKQVLAGKAYGQLPEFPVHPSEVISETEVTTYLFTGWYTERTGGTRVYPDTEVERTDDHTLYAHWEKAPTNNVIKDIVVKNNPDDDRDGVVDDIYLNLRCSSSFEKFNVALKGLIPGQRYELTYNASNDASFGDYINGYKSSVYGSYIVATSELTGGRIDAATSTIPYFGKDLLATWNDRIEPDGTNDGSHEAINDSRLQGPHNNRKIKFSATKDMMYWTWDFGLMQDGILDNYSLTNIKLKAIAPDIEFENKQLIKNTDYQAKLVSWDYDDYHLNFKFDGDSGCETIYYPITGLTPGATYTITFDHKFDGRLIHDTKTNPNPTYEYGCGIMNAKPTKTGDKMSHLGTWASNTYVMGTNDGVKRSVSLEFTATDDTAYWVWNMANASDSIECTVDAKVTNIVVDHGNDNTITWKLNSSTATTYGYTMTTLPVEPIIIDMQGITVAGAEHFASGFPLVLTISGDADMLPDLVLVDVLVGENWTFYATGLDKDLLTSYAAADGVTIAQPDWLVKNEDGSWTLTIPGEVVVSDVTIVISGAIFWSYDLYDMTIDDLSN